jgi:hypothetical protein
MSLANGKVNSHADGGCRCNQRGNDQGCLGSCPKTVESGMVARRPGGMSLNDKRANENWGKQAGEPLSHEASIFWTGIWDAELF